MIADSPDEVRVRVREQLLLGATQIKLTAGGGVASPHSPLDASTFTEAELRAAVEAAENWGTYVTVHAYTPVSIQRAIAAGVKCIEHGHLMDEADRQADRREGHLVEHSGVSRRIGRCVSARLARAGQGVRGVRRHGQRPSRWRKNTRSRRRSAPTSCSPRGWRSARANCWSSWRAGTHPPKRSSWRPGPTPNCWRMSGKRNPYPGKLGVVEEGALADLLLVDGDPIANIKLIEDPAKNFVVIMKDGKIFKNAL